ncbi:MAG: TonB-dependent receptor plug domain-containing protein [Deltaproteobacteria bacterium]|nr:TonB-dependent receptor plug domain-containing protein [Deltaproteobacteria bacterium]
MLGAARAARADEAAALDPKPPEAPAPKVDEVVVSGQREPKSATVSRMKREEYRVVPGAFGDPFRAIDVLPGLVPIVSGLPYFYVRGAPPSTVGYFVDDVRIPYLYHFALGPGVIQPALVEEVSLHPAAFPARYGRYAGGIVAGTTRDPPSEVRGEAQIRVYDAGAYLETPFAGGLGSVGAGGRYSYTAGVISLAVEDTTIDYRDYNFRASYQATDRARLTLFAFGSYDYASNTRNGVEEVFFASEYHRADLRLDHRGSDGSATRVATTIGIDRTRLEDARFAQNVTTAVRARHTRPVTKEIEVELGGDFTADHYRGDLPSRYAVSFEDYDQAVTFFSPRTDTATGVWLSGRFRPRPGWEITAAARGDVFTSAGRSALGPSPRLGMRVPLGSRVTFLGALGVAAQPPAFAIPVPAIGYRGLPGGLAFAYQKSAGAEVALPLRFTLRAVGFHHSYFNLRDFAQNRSNVEFDEPNLEPTSPLQAFGLEVFLSRKLSERYAAFLSFTLSRAQLGSTLTEASRVSPFDRTFVLQIGGVVDLGRGWRASSRFLTYGGWPLEPTGAPVDPRARLPGFARVDLRLEKRWALGERGWIAFVIEGLNVTGSRDVTGRRCTTDSVPGTNTQRCEDRYFGPIIVPSLGVEGGL